MKLTLIDSEGSKHYVRGSVPESLIGSTVEVKSRTQYGIYSKSGDVWKLSCVEDRKGKAESIVEKRQSRGGLWSDSGPYEIVPCENPSLLKGEVEDLQDAIKEDRQELSRDEAIEEYKKVGGMGNANSERLYEKLGDPYHADLSKADTVKGIGSGTKSNLLEEFG